MPTQHVAKAKEEGQKEEEDDVAMIEGEGQSFEMVGFREAHKDLHKLKNTEHVVRWICEATRKVDAASTTSGLVGEAPSRIRQEADYF